MEIVIENVSRHSHECSFESIICRDKIDKDKRFDNTRAEKMIENYLMN